jgi:hypothetical protein
MLNFCTHFNLRYLNKALALHESMEKNIMEYHLYMFVFDDQSYNFLKEANLPHVDLIHYKKFETNELLKIKKERTLTEYLWTVTPFTLIHIFNNFKVDECTYIDADIYFFNDPSPVFDEVNNYNAIITEHRYHNINDQTSVSGRFCVQFNSFVRTESSLKVLSDWQNSVAEWCFDRQENGLFGDQMYLDAWPTKYKNIHIALHPGIGVAPWNVLNYINFKNHQGLSAFDIKTKQNVQIIFYHFHGLSIYSNRFADLGNYSLNKSIYKNIYKPYLASIKNANKKIAKKMGTKDIFTTFNWSIINILRQFKRIKLAIFNVVFT